MTTSDSEEIFTTWTKDLDVDQVSIVYLCGELDASSAPAFLSDMQVLVNNQRNLVMDSHLLSYIDSTGVSALLSMKNALEKNGRKLCIVGSHGLLSKILHVTRVESEIKCFDNLDDAIEDLQSVGW